MKKEKHCETGQHIRLDGKKPKCNCDKPKVKIVKVKIPKGYNWFDSEKVGNYLKIVFIKTI